jgi:general secretion pathway protein K
MAITERTAGTVLPGGRSRGSALLAVLWLSAALAAIAFSLSSMVREETDRASTSVDGLRSYYLAVAAVERATLELMWSVQNPQAPILPPFSKIINYHFDLGDARVEVIPEAAKLNPNNTPLEVLYRLFQTLGIDPARASQITAGIASWRQGALPTVAGPFLPQPNPVFPGGGPTFPGAPASFQETEELLLVKGVTPDIFYGTYIPAPEGSGTRLIQRPGLNDCLSVFGSNGAAVDANAAAPAVLIAIGLPQPVVAALVQRRTVKPFTEQELIDFLQMAGASGIPLRAIGRTIVTYRATARLRLANGQLSDLQRTVASQVKYMPAGYDSQIHILRWYDSAWSN